MDCDNSSQLALIAELGLLTTDTVREDHLLERACNLLEAIEQTDPKGASAWLARLGQFLLEGFSGWGLARTVHLIFREFEHLDGQHDEARLLAGLARKLPHPAAQLSLHYLSRFPRLGWRQRQLARLGASSENRMHHRFALEEMITGQPCAPTHPGRSAEFQRCVSQWLERRRRALQPGLKLRAS